MAVTPVAVRINSSGSVTYTVPVGKYFVFAAQWISGSPAEVQINGTGIGVVEQVAGTMDSIMPLTANAGDVISVLSGSVGLTGNLHDASLGTPFYAALNATGPVTYTVPVGKRMVASVFGYISGGSGHNVLVNGVIVGIVNNTTADSKNLQPLCATAGDVISISATVAGLVGNLYDL